MKPLMRKIIILAAVVAVVVPSSYALIMQEASSSAQSNPYNYIPSQSSYVVSGSINSTRAYIFGMNGSTGIIIPFSVNELQLALNATSSNSSSASVTSYSTYQSQTVYLVRNLSLSSLAGNFTSGGISSLLISSFTGTNGTVYAADAGTSSMILGNITAVENSISAHNSGSTFSSAALTYMDSSSTYSFYFAPHNISPVNYITGNVSNGYSHIHISLKNNTGLGSFYIRHNGTYNVTVSSSPGSLNITVQGNYSVNQLLSVASGYLKKAGL